MSTTQTQLFPPPQRLANIPEPLLKWLFSVQNLLPLVTVDTSSGPVSITPPPAGLNSATGQSNQNMEITYIKTSADANRATIDDVEFGPFTLNAQGDFLKIKSEGTYWYRVG